MSTNASALEDTELQDPHFALTATHTYTNVLATGDAKRLVYGTDSYGFTCGTKQDFNGTTFDLSEKKKLYYLNALELLTVVNIPYARKVCIDSCPPPAQQCNGLNPSSLPCTDTEQYRCAKIMPESGSARGGCPRSLYIYMGSASATNEGMPAAISAVRHRASTHVPTHVQHGIRDWDQKACSRAHWQI